MILTDDEFIQRCESLSLSRLQIAYLIESGFIDAPMKMRKKSGKTIFFFDDFHFKSIQALIHNNLNSTTREVLKSRICKVEISDLLRQEPGLSEESLKIIRHEQQPNKSISDIYSIDLDELTTKTEDQSNWLTKVIRYLTTFKLFRIKIDAEQHLSLVVNQAVIQAMLPSKIVQFFFSRIRPFNEQISQDKCLKEYVEMHAYLGWGGFEEELKTIRKFMEFEPDLFGWPILTVLEFIKDIELEYAEVSEDVHSYREHLDPEHHIARLIAHKMLYPAYKKILFEAGEKAGNEFSDIMDGLGDSIKDTIGKISHQLSDKVQK